MKSSASILFAFSLVLLAACNAPVRTVEVPTPAAEPTTRQTGISVPPSTTPTSTIEAGVPGVISGRVDMASAPPYLNDPIVTGGLGIPVVVVAFNLDDGTWRWYDTTPTHPDYEIPVPPGRYHLVAYGIGVGDIPYVAGGYTGQNPSCGLALLEVVVGSNERVQGIDIADWNWSCHGTAYRPDKPDDAPIP